MLKRTRQEYVTLKLLVGVSQLCYAKARRCSRGLKTGGDELETLDKRVARVKTERRMNDRIVI